MTELASATVRKIVGTSQPLAASILTHSEPMRPPEPLIVQGGRRALQYFCHACVDESATGAAERSAPGALIS